MSGTPDSSVPRTRPRGRVRCRIYFSAAHGMPPWTIQYGVIHRSVTSSSVITGKQSPCVTVSNSSVRTKNQKNMTRILICYSSRFRVSNFFFQISPIADHLTHLSLSVARAAVALLRWEVARQQVGGFCHLRQPAFHLPRLVPPLAKTSASPTLTRGRRRARADIDTSGEVCAAREEHRTGGDAHARTRRRTPQLTQKEKVIFSFQ